MRSSLLVAIGLALAGCSSSSLEEAPAAGAGADGGAGEGGTTIPTDAAVVNDPAGPSRYPAAALHSPMSPAVVTRLRAVLAASPHRKDVFAKVGDSITVSPYFFNCFAGADFKWEGHERFEPTRAFFNAKLVDASKTSFNRTSLAATVGWGARHALAGDPTPIAQEVAAIKPAFAVMMFGTNDTAETNVIPFERALRADVDALLALGVVPLLSSIPPRADAAWANALVPEMNAVIRAVAQSRQIPYMDLWQKLAKLPQSGLISDGVHLSVFTQGGAHGCWFGAAALEEGTNTRNIISIEALHRAKTFLLDGTEPEPAPPALSGAGTWIEPLVIDALPFADDRDTKASRETRARSYTCGTQDEGGPEIVYTLSLDRPRKVRVRVYPDDDVDVDIHFLKSSDPASCTARHDRTLEATLDAGTHFIAIDTFVSSGVPRAGRYRMTAVALD
jgi:hypothetical protein